VKLNSLMPIRCTYYYLFDSNITAIDNIQRIRIILNNNITDCNMRHAFHIYSIPTVIHFLCLTNRIIQLITMMTE
ncbi:hypothetical protein, partial [Phocaeicola vulgatus]|uniref:hypothetical protein n=1 Tax=Phocaeicola vulgatus TaxID=821 RepID=UPI002109354C